MAEGVKKREFLDKLMDYIEATSDIRFNATFHPEGYRYSLKPRWWYTHFITIDNPDNEIIFYEFDGNQYSKEAYTSQHNKLEFFGNSRMNQLDSFIKLFKIEDYANKLKKEYGWEVE